MTQVIFNPDGDLLFSTSKDHVVNVWYSHNGERLGTYNGHNGAVWTVHVNRTYPSRIIVRLTAATSTLLVTGCADNSIKLWNVRDGTCVHTWEFNTAVKRVEFSQDGTMVLAVTEQRMGHTGTVSVFPINEGGERMTCQYSQVADEKRQLNPFRRFLLRNQRLRWLVGRFWISISSWAMKMEGCHSGIGRYVFEQVISSPFD